MRSVGTVPQSLVTKQYPFGLRTTMELFDVGVPVAISVLMIVLLIVVAGIVAFVQSAPPTKITITSGPEGSAFQKNALKYAAILEKNGVKVRVLTSNGSFENLQRLADPKAQVDVGIVQGGISAAKADNIVSLGSISYQPLLVFYRGRPIELISELAGKTVAIGALGSGARDFALKVLAANGIKEDGSTHLLNLDADDAAVAIEKGQIDAAFIMSESASGDILHKLLRSSDVHLYSFKQANAYSRKIDYLNVLDLPEGAIDLGLNIPPHEVLLLGPMVELVATKHLHPALTDLLLEAAMDVHGRPGLFQRRGDFPTPVEHAIKMSDDATRFYKSGKSFLYRFLPFWLASFASRILVVFLPMAVLLIPGLRSVPAFFRWRTQMKIRRRYHELLLLERDLLQETDPGRREVLRLHLDQIDDTVNKMKIGAAFADQFYGLRGHIDYVRGLAGRKLA
jgi:ABC-type amino acid transport substrate-binding protein